MTSILTRDRGYFFGGGGGGEGAGLEVVGAGPLQAPFYALAVRPNDWINHHPQTVSWGVGSVRVWLGGFRSHLESPGLGC